MVQYPSYNSTPRRTVPYCAVPRRAAAKINPGARVYVTDSEVVVDDPGKVRGRRVVTVDDGPTLTHGERRRPPPCRTQSSGGCQARLGSSLHAAGRRHFQARSLDGLGQLSLVRWAVLLQPWCPSSPQSSTCCAALCCAMHAAQVA